MKVTKIELVDVEETDVYDIGVKDNHNFYVYPPGSFEGLLVHNCHSANATEYSRVISRMRMKYKGGCTATPSRKDKKDFIVENLIGPVVYVADAVQMKPRVTVHITEAAPKRQGAYSRGPAAWTYMNRFLSNHEKRNAQILEGILHDLKQNRSIVIATYFKEHVTQLVKMINDAYGKQIAYAFLGGNKKVKDERKWIVDQAREGNIRVVVGIRRLLQRGLNVPRWDTLYYAMPMSNEPNWQQESRRICTPMEGKNRPLIRMFVDPALAIALGCFRNTFKQSLKFGYEPTERALDRARLVGLSGPVRNDDDDGGLYDSERNERTAQSRSKPKKSTAPVVEGSIFSRVRR